MINGVLEGEVFYQRPGVALVSWDPTSQAVYIDWQAWADSTEFESLLEAGIRALKEHHGWRCLADCRNMHAVKPSDQEWINGCWLPRAHAAGLTRMAVVVPYSGLTRMHASDMLGSVSDIKLDVAYFGTVEKATEWLVTW
ncbi:MAG: hypothetical protein M3R21_10525 [Candidatus Dormibacteraeota bacterium]|nr:hypothetical protein [Candidatus Dormibacteraeota bacterium]